MVGITRLQILTNHWHILRSSLIEGLQFEDSVHVKYKFFLGAYKSQMSQRRHYLISWSYLKNLYEMFDGRDWVFFFFGLIA